MDFPLGRSEEAPEILIEEEGEPGEHTDGHPELRLFSRGMLAQSLLRLGMEPQEAVRIATDIQDELQERHQSRISRSDLRGMVFSRLEALEPKGARYAERFRYLEERGGTLVVLIGGTSGSGKSTIAAAVARRLGIEHVVGTDFLRETLRTAIPAGVCPALHESSYTAHKTLAGFAAEEDGNVERLGFLEHARPVATGINGLLKRACEEEMQVVVEGIHVIPSLLEETYRKAPSIVLAVVSVPDEEEHRQRFVRGSHQEPRRRNATRYLQNFSAIRSIHDFLVEDAAKHGLPVVDSEDPEAAASEIIEGLWQRILAAED